MPVISPNFQSSKTKKKIKDIPGYIEIKIEKKKEIKEQEQNEEIKELREIT